MTIFCAVPGFLILEEILPELAWTGEFGVCDRSTVSAPGPRQADLGLQPVAVSWVAVAVGWPSDSRSSAHCECMTTPTSPAPCPNCPNLILDLTSIHHGHIIASQAAVCSHTFTWDLAQRVQAVAFSTLNRVIGEQKWTPASVTPQRSGS